MRHIAPPRCEWVFRTLVDGLLLISEQLFFPIEVNMYGQVAQKQLKTPWENEKRLLTLFLTVFLLHAVLVIKTGHTMIEIQLVQ